MKYILSISLLLSIWPLTASTQIYKPLSLRQPAGEACITTSSQTTNSLLGARDEIIRQPLTGSDPTPPVCADKGAKPDILPAGDDPELFPISVKGKLGYIDINGRVIIKPKFDGGDLNGRFDEEQYFKEGLAMVSEGENRGGFIDKTGRYVIEGPYYPRGHFLNGLARVSDHKNYGPYKIGFMDKTGKFVIPPRFDRAEDFSEGLAVVQVGERWGYVDKTGRMVIPPRFEDATSFRDGFALVNIRGVRRGYIDKTGRFLPMPDEVESFRTLAEGLIAVRVENKWGFINTLGQIVIQPQFDHDENVYQYDFPFGTFKDGLALMNSGGKWGYIDKAGKFVIPARFDDAKPFEGNLARVSVNGKWGLINRNGEFVAPPEFKRLESFEEGLAVVSPDGKMFGFMDTSGKLVITPQFTGAVSFSEGLAAAQTAVREGQKDKYLWGYIDKSGQFTIKPQFISHSFFSGGLARQTISEFLGIPSPSPGFHDEWGYINRAGMYVWKATD